MAKMTDLEELVSKIRNPLIKDYMKEAMGCYFSGAYRGCIVMSYISLFDDLIEKLGAIKDVNADAKTVFQEVEKRKREQDVFENYLLEQLASKSLISELDSTTINLIRERRNKSAHPSGHHPSAEEARYIFFEVVDKFLSKDVLGTKHIVDELLLRFSNQNLFVSKNITDTTTVVQHEIEKIHPDAYPYLVIEIFNEYKNSEDITKKNASFFLDGLAALDIEELNTNITSRVIEKSLDDNNLSSKCLCLISSNPKLLTLLSGVHKSRYDAIMDTALEAMYFGQVSTGLSHPSVLIRRAIDSLGIEWVKGSYPNYLEAMVQKLPLRQGVIELAAQDEDLKLALIDKVCAIAGSYTFDTANNFIERFHDVEEAFVGILTGSDCLRLVCEITKAASNGAWRSEEVVASKFDEFSILRSRVLTQVEDHSEESLTYLKQELNDTITIDAFKSRYLETAEQPA
ncbi:hypothetical protein [Vibrio lentus]|uniref:hypothetical protein n=1 Tax=Vibrio lentus TaxID=136468 RepID=UPI000C82227A|nr:hypothetical protein [Vibrio lentus]PMG65880.1 hypothetical protein BCU86_14585 [Vibrio lentus]PMJ00747.1 hypothetical protein BCU32_11105 [Vibrio lentus]